MMDARPHDIVSAVCHLVLKHRDIIWHTLNAIINNGMAYFEKAIPDTP